MLYTRRSAENIDSYALCEKLNFYLLWSQIKYDQYITGAPQSPSNKFGATYNIRMIKG